MEEYKRQHRRAKVSLPVTIKIEEEILAAEEDARACQAAAEDPDIACVYILGPTALSVLSH